MVGIASMCVCMHEKCMVSFIKIAFICILLWALRCGRNRKAHHLNLYWLLLAFFLSSSISALVLYGCGASVHSREKKHIHTFSRKTFDNIHFPWRVFFAKLTLASKSIYYTIASLWHTQTVAGAVEQTKIQMKNCHRNFEFSSRTILTSLTLYYCG